MPAKTAPPKKVKVKHNFKKDFMYLCSCCAVILLLFLTGANIHNFLATKKVLSASVDMSDIENEKNYWQQIVSQNPTYRDGYLQLAIVYDTLGNKEESLKNFEKAKLIDPNSPKIPQVQKILNLH